MPHQRKEIRQAIYDLLIGNTGAGNNVYKSRKTSIESDKLPAINIKPFREQAVLFNASTKEYKRTLTVIIAITTKGDSDLDDELDDIANEIEDILLVNDTLNDTADRIHLSDTDMVLDFGDNLIGGTVIGFDVVYFTKHQANFEDLEAINYKFKTGNSDPISETTIQIPTT